MVVQLSGASVKFGALTALRDAHLRVDAGERIALVGSNGSGKTTLLRALHGTWSAQDLGADQAWCGGLGPRGRPLRQAMVFQRPFFLRLTVGQNLCLALWLSGVPRAERRARAREALARVGLAELWHRAARTLSGGQQQRLALARAWAARPDLLLLDEPTASLDPGAKREVEALIEAFSGEGMTVVFSTHNLGQAKRLATRVLYLEAGEIVVDRPVEAFFGGSLPQAAAVFVKGEMGWRQDAM